jgi:hypothetical protein
MREPSSPPLSWSRRRFVQGAAAAGLLSPGTLLAQPAPWAQRPAGSPSRLTFVVWQDGKIYEQIAKQFEDVWGVKLNQIIEPNVEPQVAKLTTMFTTAWSATCPKAYVPERIPRAGRHFASPAAPPLGGALLPHAGK